MEGDDKDYKDDYFDDAKDKSDNYGENGKSIPNKIFPYIFQINSNKRLT